MEKDAKLVYSSDPVLNKKCPKCKELQVECVCIPEADLQGPKAPVVLRLEKSGRGGKLVTVIARLPRNENFLKNLTKALKKKCGSGGTYFMEKNEGTIEIQGDQREAIRTHLTKEGFKVKN